MMDERTFNIGLSIISGLLIVICWILRYYLKSVSDQLKNLLIFISKQEVKNCDNDKEHKEFKEVIKEHSETLGEHGKTLAALTTILNK